MKQASDSSKSRGELRLENSELISNTILENSKEESTEVPTYNVDYSETNPELDDILGDATATKAENEQQASEQQASEQQQKQTNVSLEDAMGLAVAGLNQITKMVSDITGKEVVLGEIPTTLFAVLTAPLIQKYKPKMSIDPENIDLDSWVPEVMACGGACAAGVPIWLQVKSEEKTKAVSNGDK